MGFNSIIAFFAAEKQKHGDLEVMRFHRNNIFQNRDMLFIASFGRLSKKNPEAPINMD